MKKHIKNVAILLTAVTVLGIIYFLASKANIAVLEPKGIIAAQQKDLFLFTSLLSLLVVVPVFGLTIWIVRKYREDKHDSSYHPDNDGNPLLEAIWWLVPAAIILLLAVVTWRTTHSLDPYRPIESNKKPLTVQVVALEWKWLFIYPEHNIATVNQLAFPEDTPLNLKITADAPMNSFWIPELGGQIYAMTGMDTKLHLMADQPGVYSGRSANLSGAGFSGMTFKAESMTEDDFNIWVQQIKASEKMLDTSEYQNMSKPTKNVLPYGYWTVEPDLYGKIISKYSSHKPAQANEQHGGHH